MGEPTGPFSRTRLARAASWACPINIKGKDSHGNEEMAERPLPPVEAQVGLDDFVTPEEGKKGGWREKGTKGKRVLESFFPDVDEKKADQRTNQAGDDERENGLRPAKISPDEEHHRDIAQTHTLFFPEHKVADIDGKEEGGANDSADE